MTLLSEIPIPKDWTCETIMKGCLLVTSGGTPSRKIKNFYKEGTISWVTTKELLDGYIWDTKEHITKEAIDNSSAKILPNRTILLAMYGATVGRLGIIRKEMACNQACCALLPDNQYLDTDYLYYFLLANRKKLINLATGAAQQNISGDLIKNILIPKPNIEEQKKIGKILRTLDDKIELNKKINKTLEEIAKTNFKSWFVDYDPIIAKAEGRSTGLIKEISDLFPETFEETELGKIPKGFKLDIVDNKYDISIGKTPPRNEPKWFSDGKQEVPWVSIRDMGKSGIYINNTSESLTNDAIKKFNIKIIPKDSVILSFKLTVGRVSILNKEMCTNEAIAHFVPKNNLLSDVFTYCLLKSINYENISSTSSIASAVNSKIIKKMKFIFPNKSLLIVFNKIYDPIFQKIKLNILENENLVSIRDTLLPKLINGKLSISHKKKQIRSNN